MLSQRIAFWLKEVSTINDHDLSSSIVRAPASDASPVSPREMALMRLNVRSAVSLLVITWSHMVLRRLRGTCRHLQDDNEPQGRDPGNILRLSSAGCAHYSPNNVIVFTFISDCCRPVMSWPATAKGYIAAGFLSEPEKSMSSETAPCMPALHIALERECLLKRAGRAGSP